MNIRGISKIFRNFQNQRLLPGRKFRASARFRMIQIDLDARFFLNGEMESISLSVCSRLDHKERLQLTTIWLCAQGASVQLVRRVRLVQKFSTPDLFGIARLTKLCVFHSKKINKLLCSSSRIFRPSKQPAAHRIRCGCRTQQCEARLLLPVLFTLLFGRRSCAAIICMSICEMRPAESSRLRFS